MLHFQVGSRHLKIRRYQHWMLTLRLGKYKDRTAILQDAPFSAQEFNNTWKQSCAFEVLGRAWLPTPSAVAMVWKSIMSAATIKGVNLEKKFDLNSVGEIVGNDGFPLALFEAIVMRLVSDTDFVKDDCEHETIACAFLNL